MNTEPRTDIRPDQDLAALAGAQVSAKPVPTRVLLAPWGQVESTHGTFTVDEESAQLVIEALAAHGTDLPIDYEHQTLGGRFSSPTGQAPAAGWIQGIEAEPGIGLFAHVRWTEAALEQLANGQYRYLSPVAIVRRSDRKLIGLHSAALTNKPAIAHMEPIVHRAEPGAMVDEASACLALRQQLALADPCGSAEVMAAAKERIATLEAETGRRDACDRVEAALRAGKLSDAQRGWALRLALADGELFEEWIQSAPTIVPLGRTESPRGVAATEPCRARLAAAARAEYRAHPALGALTSEEAYVADAVRNHGE